MSSCNCRSTFQRSLLIFQDIIAASLVICRCGAASRHRSFIPIWMQYGVTFIHFVSYTAGARTPSH